MFNCKCYSTKYLSASRRRPAKMLALYDVKSSRASFWSISVPAQNPGRIPAGSQHGVTVIVI